MSTTNASPETERAGLSEFLDYQREALIDKLQGLSDEEATDDRDRELAVAPEFGQALSDLGAAMVSGHRDWASLPG